MPDSLNDGCQALNGKALALLSYIPFLCIVPLLCKKGDSFVLFHGRQGLAIFVFEIGVFILSIIFPWILRPGMFVLLVLSFIGLLAVLRGKTVDLPLVNRLAEKINL